MLPAICICISQVGLSFLEIFQEKGVPEFLVTATRAT
jgi:hypothetical protein